MSIIHLAWERNENPVPVLEFRCCSASHLYMPSPYMRCAVRNSQVNKVLFTAWTTYYSLLSGPCFVHPTLQYSTKFPNQGTRLIFIWGLLSLITRVPRPWLCVVVSSPYRYHYVSCTDVRPTFHKMSKDIHTQKIYIYGMVGYGVKLLDIIFNSCFKAYAINSCFKAYATNSCLKAYASWTQG